MGASRDVCLPLSDSALSLLRTWQWPIDKLDALLRSWVALAAARYLPPSRLSRPFFLSLAISAFSASLSL